MSLTRSGFYVLGISVAIRWGCCWADKASTLSQVWHLQLGCPVNRHRMPCLISLLKGYLHYQEWGRLVSWGVFILRRRRMCLPSTRLQFRVIQVQLQGSCLFQKSRLGWQIWNIDSTGCCMKEKKCIFIDRPLPNNSWYGKHSLDSSVEVPQTWQWSQGIGQRSLTHNQGGVPSP